MKKLEDMTEPELRELMDMMGHAIQMVAEKMGVVRPLFALLLFNDPKVAQYVANCEPADVVAAIKEAAERLERREDVTR